MFDLPLLILIPVAVVALVLVGIFLSYFGTWLKARLNGAPVRIVNLVGMRLGGVPYGLVVSVRITAVKAGIEEMCIRDSPAARQPGQAGSPRTERDAHHFAACEVPG